MDQLRQTFHDAQSLVRQLLDKLDHGVFLSSEDLMHLFGCFNQISEQQSRCLAAIQQQTGLSTADCHSLADLEAVLERHLSFTKRIAQARALIDAFLGVTTVEALFSAELEKHQAPLRALDDAALLDRYESGALEPYRLFLSCIDGCTIEETNPLIAHFGFQLAYGLLGHKFRAGTPGVLPAAELSRAQDQEAPAAQEEPAQTKAPAAQEEPAQTDAPAAQEEPAQSDMPAAEEETAHTPEDVYAALRMADSDIGTYKKAVNRCKGSSSFISLLHRKSDHYWNGLSYMLELLLQSYGVDVEYCLCSKYAQGIEDQMLTAIHQLMREGIIARHTLNDDKEQGIYTLTSEGERIIGNKSFQKNHLNWKYLFKPEGSSITDAGSFLRYKTALHAYNHVLKAKDSYFSLEKFQNFYIVKGSHESEPDAPLFIFVPLIYTDADDPAHLTQMLDKLASVCGAAKPHAVLCVAAYAAQQDAWRERIASLAGLRVCFCEPGSDAYTAEDGTQRTLDEIIKPLFPNPDEEIASAQEEMPDSAPADELAVHAQEDTPAPEKVESIEESIEAPVQDAPQEDARAQEAAQDNPEDNPAVQAESEDNAAAPSQPANDPAQANISDEWEDSNTQTVRETPEYTSVFPSQSKSEDTLLLSLEHPESTEALAASLAALRQPLMHDKALHHLVVRLLGEDRFMEAVVLTRAIADSADGAAFAPLHTALLCAVNSPLSHPGYTAASMNTLAAHADDPLIGWAQLCCVLFASCFPLNAYNYDLFSAILAYRDGSQIPGLLPDHEQSGALHEVLRRALTLLADELRPLSFDHLDGQNFSAAVRSLMLNDTLVAEHCRHLQKLASECLETPRSSIHLPMDSFFKLSIGPASPIGQAITAIASGATESVALCQRALDGFAPEEGAILSDAIEAFIDECWNELRRQDKQLKTRSLDNGSKARNLAFNELSSRLSIIDEWLKLCGSPDQRITDSLERIKAICGRLQNHFSDAVSRIDSLLPSTDAVSFAGLRMLRQCILRISAILSGREEFVRDPLSVYLPLLCGPFMSLDDAGYPLLDKALHLIPGMEPWRLMLRHIACAKVSAEEALTAITEHGVDPLRYENFASARILCRALSLPFDCRDELHTAVRSECLEMEEDFMSDVRLACAYGQIDEATKETVFAQLREVRHLFLGSDNQPCANYAHFRMLLDVLNSEIDEERRRVKHKFTERFHDLLRRIDAGAPRPQMLDLIEKELSEDNFAMAEEYFNRFDPSDMSPPSEDHTASIVNFHAQFLENAEWYREQCDQPGHRGSKLRTWGSQMLRRSNRNFWSAANERNADSPLDFWPIARDVSSTANDLKKLMRLLGFSVDHVALHERAVQYEVFKAQARPVVSGLPDYAHPVAKFGTLLQSPLNIVCLYGCKGADTLIDILAQKLQLGTTSIVLLDGALNMVERRKVAAKFKADTSGQNAFLLIDRVLILYLSALDQGVRLNAMLQCTLPYTYDQLYTNGTGSVPDEMFIGRLSDRKKLTDINGSCLVYGGRQLGKTALLKRVTHLCSNEAEGRYALYIDIKDRGYEDTVNRLKTILSATLIKGTPLISDNCRTLEEICDAIAARRNDFNQLSLFFDEADCFLDEIAPRKYAHLHPLVVLRRDALANRFKFVLAGTHNVAATANTISDNSDILQLGQPLCIEPLSMADATRLIKLPLSYLGFEIGSRQIALILANTNSYPGLIHLFCNALVTSVCDNYAEHYSVGAGNPPYQVTDDQLRAIFRQTDIKHEISRRVMATIEVDSKYVVVANLLAYLEFEDQSRDNPRLYGYTPAELLSCNLREFEIESFMRMREDEMNALMAEMQSMGILWKQTDSPHYRFRQRDFLSYFGSSDQAMTKLFELYETDKGGDRA